MNTDTRKNLTTGMNPPDGGIGDNNLFSFNIVTLFIIMTVNSLVSYVGHFTPEVRRRLSSFSLYSVLLVMFSSVEMEHIHAVFPVTLALCCREALPTTHVVLNIFKSTWVGERS